MNFTRKGSHVWRKARETFICFRSFFCGCEAFRLAAPSSPILLLPFIARRSAPFPCHVNPSNALLALLHAYMLKQTEVRSSMVKLTRVLVRNMRALVCARVYVSVCVCLSVCLLFVAVNVSVSLSVAVYLCMSGTGALHDVLPYSKLKTNQLGDSSSSLPTYKHKYMHIHKQEHVHTGVLGAPNDELPYFKRKTQNQQLEQPTHIQTYIHAIYTRAHRCCGSVRPTMSCPISSSHPTRNSSNLHTLDTCGV
jgi:hypothetical protein